MIWLTWRQFRTQALIAGIALAALAAYMLYLGAQIRHGYSADVVNCLPSDCSTTRRLFQNRYEDAVMLLGVFLIAVPGLIGVFWGAPLIARELESKTDRLVWNQSVTRRRWLAVKLLVLGTVAVAVTGLYSLLLTSAASRWDQWSGNRFSSLIFGARNVAPLGYAAFAFVLGVLVGLLLRRTVASMAIVAAVYVVLQIVVPMAIRVHLMPPVTTTVAFNMESLQRGGGIGMNPTSAHMNGYTMPGTWALDDVDPIFNADGTPFTSVQAQPCMTGRGPDEDMACFSKLNLHFQYRYQPGSRYWPFQWIELSAYLVLTALLTGVGFFWIRRRIS